MKKILYYTLCAALFYSCGVKHIDSNSRANIHLPAALTQEPEEKQKDKKLPSVIDMKDRHGNVTTYVQTQTDKEGNAQLSVQLSEVTVTAKMKNVPERLGKVDVDFIVSVPQELIGSKWQLNLTPHLIKRENISDFEDLVISGDDFKKLQQKQYMDFDKYLSKIVPDSLFDTYFVRTGAFHRYIARYDKAELHRVFKDSTDHLGYSKYKTKMNKRYDYFNKKMYRNRSRLKKQMSFSGIKERYEYFAQDTVHIAAIYNKWYNRIVNLLPHSDTLDYIVSSMIQFLDTTPRFMRKIIERKALATLRANITFKTGKYDMDIGLGENSSELDKVQDMLDKLTGTGEFVVDSISLIAGCSPEGSFRSNMLLSQKRAASIGKHLNAELSGIEGIEKILKPYHKGEDWLGLSKLVTDSLSGNNKQAILELIAATTDPDRKETEIRNKFPADYKYISERLYPHLRAVDFTFHVHRRGMVKDTIHTTEPDTVYLKAIKLMAGRKYADALQILHEYNDYNTAICLMSLGYDIAAYSILAEAVETANGEYLLAILSSRLGKSKEAVSRYLRSVELDPAKRWRGTLDPEINKLIKAYNLHNDDEQ